MPEVEMPHDRIVFLDIDGVLNHAGTIGEDGEDAPWRREAGELLRVPIAPECMDRLNRLVAQTGARIVISSSWRLFARWQDLGPALARHGLVGEVVGETPDLVNDPAWLEAWRTREGAPFHHERLERGWEIAEWLRLHPEVTSFAILDDCSDMAGVRDRLVLVDSAVGLDDPDVERAKRLLDGSTDTRHPVRDRDEDASTEIEEPLPICEVQRIVRDPKTKITMASQDAIDDLRPYVDRVFAAVRNVCSVGSDAWISDESCLTDFFDYPRDRSQDQLLYDRIGEELGISLVRESESEDDHFIARIALRLRRRDGASG
jgi:hypothetical protein